jgi:hypothetical protein
VGLTVERRAGSCFGYEVRSSLGFRYLRGGTGQPLRISNGTDDSPEPDERLVLEWRPIPGRQLHARLYHDVVFRLWVAGVGSFTIDPRVPSITVPEADDTVRREERLWGIPAVVAFLQRGDTPLHAAAVEVNGDAVLLAAPSRFGKTTLAAGFHCAGFRLLAEDLSCIRTGPDAAVIPGPAMLRLRPDVAEALRLPAVEQVGEDEDRIHFALGAEGRGTCAPVPIRGIVLLRESMNGHSLERVPAAEAIPELWALSFKLPTEADRSRCFNDLAGVADAVPVWNLSRPLSLKHLPATVRYIARHV